MKSDSTIDPRKIDPENLYSLHQVADFLNISYGTVLKLKTNDAFGNGLSNVGKKFYVSGRAILDYIKER